MPLKFGFTICGFLTLLNAFTKFAPGHASCSSSSSDLSYDVKNIIILFTGSSSETGLVVSITVPYPIIPIYLVFIWFNYNCVNININQEREFNHSSWPLAISSCENTHLCVAIAQQCPYGSLTFPIRSPQNASIISFSTMHPASMD